MNEEQLIDNLLTFYLAGHETTAKALTWTLYLLARSPEWTAALKDEIARVTGGAPWRPSTSTSCPDPAGHQGRHAPVPAGARHEPPGGRGYFARGAPDHGRNLHRHSDLCACTATNRAGATPSMFDPTRFAPEQEASDLPLPVHAVRRGPAHLHRHGLRHDRGHRHAGDDAAVGRASSSRAERDPMPIARVTLVPEGRHAAAKYGWTEGSQLSNCESLLWRLPLRRV